MNYKLVIGIVVGFTIILSIIIMASSLLKEEAVNNYLTISKLNAKSFSKELNQDLSNIEQVIDNIPSLIDLYVLKDKINSRLIDIQRNYPQIRSINILKNEIVEYSSNKTNLGLVVNNLNLFPQPIFEDNILKISTPWIGRDFINGNDVYSFEDKIEKNESFFIPISKKINAKIGNFTVIVNLNNDYFENRFLSNIKSNEVIFELVRLDGILLLSTDKSKAIGKKIKEDKLLEQTIEKSEITGIETIEGTKYIITYILTDNFPINLSVKLDYDKSLISWDKKQYNFFIITIITIVLTTLIALFLFYLYNRTREHEIILHKQQLEEQEKFKLLFEDSHLLAAVLDDKGKILDINNISTKFLNEKKKHLKGLKFWDLDCWDINEKAFLEEILLFGDIEKNIQKELKALTSNKEEAIIDFNLSTIHKEGLYNYIVIGQDITQRKDREKRLKQAYSVFNNTRDGIMITDKDTKLIDVNRAFTKITGYDKKEILDLKINILKSDIHTNEFYKNMWDKINKDGYWEGEVTNKTKNGNLFTEWLTINTIFDKDKNVLNYIGVFSDITEQNIKDKKIKENEAKLKKIFNYSGIGIARVGLNGEWLEVNDKLCQIIGYGKEELLNVTFQDITYPDDLDKDLEYVNKMINQEIDSYEMVKRYIKKDASLIWIKLTVTIILKEDGKPNYFISIIQDINDEKLNDERLEKKNQELVSLKNALDNAIKIADLGTWEWDIINDIFTWSDITYNIYGLDKKKKVNIEFLESLILEDDLEKHRKQVETVLKEKTSFHFEYRIKKDGEIKTLTKIGNPIIENGKVVKLIGAVQDITYLKEQEKELLEAQSISKIGHYDYDMQSNSFTTSQILDNIFGISSDYKKSFDTWIDLIHPEDKTIMYNYFQKIIQNQEKFDKEYRIIDYTTRETKWVHGLGIFVNNKETNEPEKLFGTIQDITTRKNYEKNMHQALLVFKNTHDGIVITDSNNRIISINPAFTQTTGYEESEVLGENPSILKSNKQDSNFYKNMWKKIYDEGHWSGEIINKNKNGNTYEELLSISSIKQNNKIENYVGIFSDITTQKQQEKMLLQQSRTSAVGEMIGNIAHQWRQPLSIISTASTGLKLSLEMSEELFSKEEVMNTLDKINEHTQHLSKTIDDFRNFFKGDISFRKEFNLKETLLRVEELTADSFNHNFIEVHKNLLDDIYIEGNDNLLIQALINIYNNAIDALKENEQGEKLFFISLEKEKDKTIVKLKDNAGGIDEKIFDKIFEPYFTTKHESMGTGLGLYMTYQIITKQFHGNISVFNEKYSFKNKELVGAVFRIEL